LASLRSEIRERIAEEFLTTTSGLPDYELPSRMPRASPTMRVTFGRRFTPRLGIRSTSPGVSGALADVETKFLPLLQPITARDATFQGIGTGDFVGLVQHAAVAQWPARDLPLYSKRVASGPSATTKPQSERISV
jgi:hypothetical protein